MRLLRLTALVLPASAAVALTACGYPSFTFNGTGGSTTTMITGAGGSDTTTSTASSGGGGSTTTTTTTTTTTAAGTGGTGGTCEILHPGGGTCEYLPGAECGCGDNQKCAVTVEAKGESSCILIGASPLPAWSKCNSDNDCAAGTFCDHLNGNCKPICNSVGDCPAGAQCIPAIRKGTANTEIPGLKVCTSHCDPMSGAPCGSNLTCYYDVSEAEFDCSTTKKLGAGASCQYADDCDKGLVCVGSGGSSSCEYWCHPTDDFIPNGFCAGKNFNKSYCLGVTVSVQYGGDDYGICSP